MQWDLTYICKIILYWLKKAPFINFWDIWQDTYRPVIFLWILWAFFMHIVIFANFSDVGKMQASIMLLEPRYIKLENISEFSLIILVGISSSCDALEASMFFISLITSSSVIWLKVYTGPLLILLFVVKILGCLRYFNIAFKVFFFSGMFRILIMFEKKLFKNFAISLSFAIIFSLSTNVIFSLLQIYLKALALPFSKIFDYLWHFFFRLKWMG